MWAAAAGIAVAGCGSGATKTVTVISSSATTSASLPNTGTGEITLTESTASSTAAATTSTTSAAAPVHVVHLTTFESPSRNIGCVVLDGTARCDIEKRDWKPPPHPSSCSQEVDFGQGLEVGESGPGGFVCAGDTAMDPSAPLLPYSSASVEGKFRCVSATTGMTCTDTATSHGFFISIQSYRAF
jgi:hypothetical protein